MGEYAGIAMIFGYVFLLIDFALITTLVYFKLKLNEFKSIVIFIARWSTYLSIYDWQKIYNDQLTLDDFINWMGYQYEHTRKKSGKHYSNHVGLEWMKAHEDTDKISIHGISSTDQQDVNKDLMEDPMVN